MNNNIMKFLFLLVPLFFVINCGNSGNPAATPATTTADFNVTVADKTPAHPYFGQGSTMGYVINGVQGMELTLKRGTTYTFGVNGPGHLFFITTDAVGGSSAGTVTDGVSGNEIASGTLTFTPNANHPALLYYQCSIHANMGWKINITN